MKMVKPPTWKRILGGLIAFLTPAIIYILFVNEPMLDFIPFMYVFFSVVAALCLGIIVLVNEDIAL
jgi:uncharacterized membrane protein YccC